MPNVGGVTVTGTGRLLANLRMLGAEAPRAVEAALFEFGSKVEGDAKGLVPVRDGILRASGFTMTNSLRTVGPGAQPSAEAMALATNTVSEVRAVVGFGGPAVAYALIQHERTDFHHRIGQAKYLSEPMQNRAAELPVILAQHVDRAIAKAARGTA